MSHVPTDQETFEQVIQEEVEQAVWEDARRPPAEVPALPPPEQTEEQALAEVAHALDQRLREIGTDLTVRLFQVGYILKRIRDEGLWRYLGCDSFTAYLSVPHVSLRRSSAWKYMGLYETYVVKLALGDNLKKIAGVDLVKLDMIRAVLTLENWEFWVEKARTLSRTDLRIELDVEKTARRLRARGVEVSVAPTADPPAGPTFAHENEQLTALLGDIIEELILTPQGLILRTDTSSRLRVWATGDELRIDVKSWKPTEDVASNST